MIIKTDDARALTAIISWLARSTCHFWNAAIQGNGNAFALLVIQIIGQEPIPMQGELNSRGMIKTIGLSYMVSDTNM